tara:strand:+ start:972 stop:1478 length:507 start_codon:yes stop_codon:yes gene_type:complete
MAVDIVRPRPDVTAVLSSHIRTTVKSWHRQVVAAPITYEMFSKWQIPSDDLTTAPPNSTFTLGEGTDAAPVRTAKELLKASDVTNACVYNPMSGMFWHTNSNLVGKRLYYTFGLDHSVFKYKDPQTGEEHESWDAVGWTCRTFDILDGTPLWHSVWTSGRRFSFGFML